ncbi:helix-turn-helix transcriptional regulator [Streptacidiphilus sp. EB129]|uniref:helix-turn-helix transcriptional regulator n=1 Tax=Streptacidiphilus sp. EB129 TaxID=3156262 RepID=UPI003515507C
MIDRERLWSHNETAAYLGISASTLYQLNWKGRGPRSARIGKYRRYNPADVVSWVEDRSGATGAAE